MCPKAVNLEQSTYAEGAASPKHCAQTVRELLEGAGLALAGASTCPTLDAEVLLAASLGCGRSRLYAWPEWVPEPAEIACFHTWLAKRSAGYPVAYLLGQREFWGLNLRVSEATLIPRPETERLVELALERIDPEHTTDVADLGTGSGAVALALAQERPLSRIVASDLSEEALDVARENAQRLGIGNINFEQGDWFGGISSQLRMDVVVSNPPYIAEDDRALIDLRYEPRPALVAGADGLAAIRHIVAEAPRWLRRGGWILIEHGADQGLRVAGLLRQYGYQTIATERDLGGLERVSLGQRPLRAPPMGSA
jgi:release factor glutamine methyltransferase